MLTVCMCLILPAADAAALNFGEVDWGVLLCSDDNAKHVTLVGDADYARMLGNAPAHVRAGLKVPVDLFPLRREGWYILADMAIQRLKDTGLTMAEIMALPEARIKEAFPIWHHEQEWNWRDGEG